MSESYTQRIEDLLHCIRETSEGALRELPRCNGDFDQIKSGLKDINRYVNDIRGYIYAEERRVK